jgi:PadR family transcriptional regulator, regulatory protein PadR
MTIARANGVAVRFDKELVAASATPIILATLAGIHDERGSYGYAIIKEVERLSDQEMSWTEGMLYPVLHRLEEQGFIAAHWETAKETGKRRKYYRITAAGAAELERLKLQWELVDRILRSAWR